MIEEIVSFQIDGDIVDVTVLVNDYEVNLDPINIYLHFDNKAPTIWTLEALLVGQEVFDWYEEDDGSPTHFHEDGSIDDGSDPRGYLESDFM
tara:strand:+ start:124 stop:399 length:276 start_codon:yes stop_codon:yes gene_type:complete